MNSDPDASPVNPLPPVVLMLFLAIAGIEVVFSLGQRGIIGGPEAVGWRLDALRNYAFFDQIFGAMIEQGQYPLEHMMRFVTYAFVNGSFTQTLFVCVFLLALGKLVGEVFGALATLTIFVFSAIMGALAYGIFLDESLPLIGGFPVVYGLIGAYTFTLWLRLGALGENQMRAFTLIGFLMGIQLLFGLLFGGTRDWVADVAGFLTGFVSCFILAPGAWRLLLARLRQR
jgi:membrane associated rhomboid family serine protease